MSSHRTQQVFDAIDRATGASGDDMSFVGHGDGRRQIIDSIEKTLKTKLPETYKSFLMRYGLGGDYRLEIEGIGIDGDPVVIQRTLECRSLYKKFHDKLVFLSHGDDWNFCMDTSMINKDGDCPVVAFDYADDEIVLVSMGFLDFLIEKFELKIE